MSGQSVDLSGLEMVKQAINFNATRLRRVPDAEGECNKFSTELLARRRAFHPSRLSFPKDRGCAASRSLCMKIRLLNSSSLRSSGYSAVVFY